LLDDKILLFDEAHFLRNFTLIILPVILFSELSLLIFISMKNIKSVNTIVSVIGLIGLLFGAYDIFKEGASQNSLFLIFIGVVLIGTAYINNQELSKKS
jgi:hypothetical protein